MKKLHFGLIVASLALVAAPAVMAQNITIVNGKAVPQSAADALISQATKQTGQPATPQLIKQAKDAAVMREIFTQEAQARGLQKSPDYLQQLELNRQDLLIRALFQDEEKKHPITEADMKAEYDKFKAQAPTKEYHARHILVETEAEAKSLIAQLKKGANFEELAKKHSKDPGSAENGGDLDWAGPNSYVPEFSSAMMALKKGQFTETPVKSQYGYHIIKLEDTRETKFPAYEDVKQQIQQRLTQQRLAAFRDSLKNKAKTDYKFSN